jgi:hypothetical protein
MSRGKAHKGPKHKGQGGPTPPKHKPSTVASGQPMMSFGAFRKHQKAILWVTVIVAIVAFGLVSSWGAVQAFIEGDPAARPMATFVVPDTGETKTITADAFNRTAYGLRRVFGSSRDLTDDDVLRHMMLVADARAAGLEVSDAELAERLVSLGLGGLTKQQYSDTVVSRIGFASVGQFESLMRETVLADRYVQLHAEAASVVDSEELYLQWRVDNALFDYEALVFVDRDAESIADPGDEDLRTWFDELPESRRAGLFREPPKRDIVVAWLGLDADLEALPEEKLSSVGMASDTKIESRFMLERASRWPDMAEDAAMTDEIREELRQELRVIDYVRAAYAEFSAAETKDKASFLAAAEAWGLAPLDPEGLLGPEAIEALDPVGTKQIANLVQYAPAGEVRFSQPFGDVKVVTLLYVEEAADPRPLEFDEARDQVLEEWRKTRMDQEARDFREALTARAKALPEAQEAIQPLLDAAELTIADLVAQAQADGIEELDEEAIREAEMEAIDADISARVAEYEHLVWDDAKNDALSHGATLELFAAVPKSYVRNPDGEEETTSRERFLKTSPLIFNQAVDGITPVLRHAGTNSSTVVRITARELPEKTVMWEDPEGMTTSRRSLGFSRLFEARGEFMDPESLKVSHQLEMIEVEEAPAQP